MQETTFYLELQNNSELDFRDNRGKRHKLAFILLGTLIGLLRNRDGKLSSIHRSMVNTNSQLCAMLGIDTERVVSRAHLPRVLSKVDIKVFEGLLFQYFGIELNSEQKRWFAGDGKELRGSIEKGNKRGQAIVQLVSHGDRKVLGQGFYSGLKESEKACLQRVISQNGAASQKITADALHLSPAMAEPIEKAGGVFLIGLKGNQKELLADMETHIEHFSPADSRTDIEKGHGRIEKRSYRLYDVSQEYFDERWGSSGFRSLVVADRERIELKTNKLSSEKSFYISNGYASEDNGYFNAVRNHWSIEVSNHIRDVSMKEDSMRTNKNEITTIFATLRTLAIALIGRWKPKNIIAQLELFQDDFSKLFLALREIQFL